MVLALATVLAVAGVALAADRQIACGQDLDAVVNGDGGTTATRFILEAGCQHQTSATVILKDGDQLVCATRPTFREIPIPERQGDPHAPDSAYDPTVFCDIKPASAVETTIARRGDTHIEGIHVRGGQNYNGTGSGQGIADGQHAPTGTAYGIVVSESASVGISNCHGDYNRIELFDNTNNPDAIGVTGSGIKCIQESVIRHSWVHDEQGNGIWCDEGCTDTSNGKWHVNFNVVERSGTDASAKDGIRWEFDEPGVANPGEALIEHNLVTDNTRTGVQARDAGTAEIRDNIFGGNGTAVRASDSGRSDRFNLVGIWIHHNVLNGDELKGCELPDSVVRCDNNGGSSGSLSEPSEPAPDEPAPGEPSSSDIDGDGIPNADDPDKDGDGVSNGPDDFPKDPERS